MESTSTTSCSSTVTAAPSSKTSLMIASGSRNPVPPLLIPIGKKNPSSSPFFSLYLDRP